MKVDQWQVRLIQLLTIPGMFAAYYLWLFHQGQVTTLCTDGLFDCGKVSGPEAPYSSLGPLPVALIGLVGYGVIFLLTWLPAWIPWIDRNLPELLFVVSGLGFLASVGLTLLEVLVIHAACQYCVISAVIMTIIFALAVSYLWSETRASAKENADSEIGTGERLDVA